MQLGNKAVTALESLYAEDKVSIALFGDSIVFNEQPLAGKSLHVTHFMKKLRRKGIDKVIIARGVTGTELRNFCLKWRLPTRSPVPIPTSRQAS